MWVKLRNLLAGGIFSKLLLGLANIWVIRGLSQSDFALFNNFLNVQAFISGLVFTPFLLASVAKSNLFQIENKRRLLNALNVIQTVGILLLTMTVWLIGPNTSVFLFHNQAYFTSLWLGLLASIFLTLQNLVLSEHQSNESFGEYNLINIARPVLILAGLGVCSWTGHFSFWPIAGIFMTSAVLSVLRTGRYLMEFSLLRGLKFKVLQLRWFWKQAKALILFFFIRGCVDHIGLFISTRFFSLEESAGYGVAFRYYAMADLIIASSHVLFLSSFTKNDARSNRYQLFKWTRVAFPASFLAFMILPWFSEIYAFINKEMYAYTFSYLLVFVGGLVFYLSFSPAIYALIQKKQFTFLLVLSLVGIGGQIAVSAYGVATHSLWFIALGTVVARGSIYFFSWIKVYLQPDDR